MDMNERQSLRWDKKNQKARAFIDLSIEDNQLLHIREKLKALDTWKALKEAQEKDTLTNKISIYNTIALLRMQPGDNIERHIDHLVDLFQRLADLGKVAPEIWKIGMLFASLPKSYSTLVTALEARDKKRNYSRRLFYYILAKITAIFTAI